MKTKYKYIHFVYADIKNESAMGGRLNQWVCRNNKSKSDLGLICFNGKWRCWEFWPDERSAFTTDCLADIIDFLKQLEKE